MRMDTSGTLAANVPEIESSIAHEPAAGTCATCGAETRAKYCPECGEAVHGHRDLSIAHFVQHALHDLTHFDTRFFRTLKLLVMRPGELSVRAIEGRSKSVMKPFQLFLVLNLVFFLLNTSFFQWHLETYEFTSGSQPTEKLSRIQDRMSALKISPETYHERFDAKLHTNEKGFIFLLIPVLALVLELLYLGRHRYFVEHLIASTHFLSFMLLFLLLSQVVIGLPLLAISAIADLMGYTISINEELTILIIFVALISYLWPALRRTYGDRAIGSLLRSLVASAAVIPLILLYREFLFWVTFWSI